MALEIGTAASLVNQDMTNNKTQAGFDVLTKTTEKTEQMQINEQQRLEIAEQTGKGLNLDVTA
ncbi:hypothetical protein [Pelovirga terrestris]|uniref:Uncharacterized protein n=1 Tax=Pelovirga terrestris TaxID=2771352 RepID=A0A8J6QTW5_9BACT|nr:hypothetical protein [Pelovirga terrestris]MBD1399695.1 hypothetical protein [Pelovirga terrestris]